MRTLSPFAASLLLAPFLTLFSSAQTSSAQSGTFQVYPVSGPLPGMPFTKVNPIYPEEARARHISGTVKLRVSVGKDGGVKEVKPLTGPPIFIPASEDAVRQWRYVPYRVGREPVAMDLTVTLNFRAAGDELPPAPSQPDPPTVLHVPGGAMAGQILTKVQPVFPEQARRKHINGAVVLHVLIGKEGKVKEITAASGPAILIRNYTEAVRQWTFRPFVISGQPAEVDTTITLSMQMNGS